MEQLLYTINFKRIALANKVTVRDGSGAVVSYSHQKLLKLKERVLFYNDTNKTQQIAEINADSVIDYNVKYTLTNQAGEPTYVLNRVGRKSIWKANYQISDVNGAVVARINEKSAITKVLDHLFGSIPIIGLFAGYVFHAEYIVSNPNGEILYTIKKRPAFLESNFEIYGNNNITTMSLEFMQILTMAIMRERQRS